MKKLIFEGSGVAIVTPFKNNKIDFETLGQLIEFNIENSTDAIIVCGTTGEAATMSNDEHLEAIKYTVKKVNKRVPVIAGAGINDTTHSIFLSQEAEKAGVDGLLLVTPYYNKTTQKGLVEHFTAIANSVKVPVILYNVPSRTGLNISVDTCKKLSKIENIVAVKEASGNISQVAQISRECGDDLYIYSGNDDQILPVTSLGGKGVISVVANILPKETHDIYYLYKNGHIKESLDLQHKMLNLINALFIEVNPIPVKEAMNMLGYNVGGYRLPLTEMDPKNREKLKQELIDYGFDLK